MRNWPSNFLLGFSTDASSGIKMCILLYKFSGNKIIMAIYNIKIRIFVISKYKKYEEYKQGIRSKWTEIFWYE